MCRFPRPCIFLSTANRAKSITGTGYFAGIAAWIGAGESVVGQFGFPQGKPTSSIATTPQVESKRLRCIGSPGALGCRNFGGLYRRRSRSGRSLLRDWPHRPHATSEALSQGCAAYLGTPHCRTEQRFDARLEVWSFPIGPCFRHNPKGNLRSSIDSFASMTDTAI